MILSFPGLGTSVLSIYQRFLLLKMRTWFVHGGLPPSYNRKNWQTLYYTFLRLGASVLSIYRRLFLLRMRTWFVYKDLTPSYNWKDWQPLRNIFLGSVAFVLFYKLAKTFKLFYSLASTLLHLDPFFFLFHILWCLVFVSALAMIGFALHGWQVEVGSLSKSYLYIVQSWIVDVSHSILVLDDLDVFFCNLA